MARRYAGSRPIRKLAGGELQPVVLDSQLTALMRAMRAEVEKLLQERLARLHASPKNQAAFLVNRTSSS